LKLAILSCYAGDRPELMNYRVFSSSLFSTSYLVLFAMGLAS
jgi:hypothetical protein